MFLIFDDRPSDSPFVERVWHCHSERAGTFLSVAASHSEMVVTRHKGKTFLTLRGPETKVTTENCPAECEWLGIRFKLGTFIPGWSRYSLMTGILFLAAFVGIASGSKGPVSLYFALAVVLGFVWISTLLARLRREVTG